MLPGGSGCRISGWPANRNGWNCCAAAVAATAAVAHRANMRAHGGMAIPTMLAAASEPGSAATGQPSGDSVSAEAGAGELHVGVLPRRSEARGDRIGFLAAAVPQALAQPVQRPAVLGVPGQI